YFMMVLGNNLFEAFKEDVTEAVIPASVYVDTFRRKFIDTAGKLVRHAGKLVLKVSRLDAHRLRFDRLYEKCQTGLPQLC
ncbi:MAG TPA: IS1380 family transposase, partial [Chlorobaculum parvum]|nr:IS1380 family transposase [Chlorobaculum parvum]